MPIAAYLVTVGSVLCALLFASHHMLEKFEAPVQSAGPVLINSPVALRALSDPNKVVTKDRWAPAPDMSSAAVLFAASDFVAPAPQISGGTAVEEAETGPESLPRSVASLSRTGKNTIAGSGKNHYRPRARKAKKYPLKGAMTAMAKAHGQSTPSSRTGDRHTSQ